MEDKFKVEYWKGYLCGVLMMVFVTLVSDIVNVICGQ